MFCEQEVFDHLGYMWASQLSSPVVYLRFSRRSFLSTEQKFQGGTEQTLCAAITLTAPSRANIRKEIGTIGDDQCNMNVNVDILDLRV